MTEEPLNKNLTAQQKFFATPFFYPHLCNIPSLWFHVWLPEDQSVPELTSGLTQNDGISPD